MAWASATSFWSKSVGVSKALVKRRRLSATPAGKPANFSRPDAGREGNHDLAGGLFAARLSRRPWPRGRAPSGGKSAIAWRRRSPKSGSRAARSQQSGVGGLGLEGGEAARARGGEAGLFLAKATSKQIAYQGSGSARKCEITNLPCLDCGPPRSGWVARRENFSRPTPALQSF